MGNCPTCSLDHANKSLDPMCNGKRMWITFVFSSFSLLIVGGIISVIYKQVHKLSIKLQHRRHLTNTKNVRHSTKINISDVLVYSGSVIATKVL
jgi:hypothetical protein